MDWRRGRGPGCLSTLARNLKVVAKLFIAKGLPGVRGTAQGPTVCIRPGLANALVRCLRAPKIYPRTNYAGIFLKILTCRLYADHSLLL